MDNRFQNLAEKAVSLGASEARLIETSAIEFDERSLLKCRFGCNRWGKFWTCRPHLDMTMEKFQEMLTKYSEALVLQTSEPRKAQEITLEIEKTAMLEHGAMYAFGLALCVMCEECAYPEPCRYPHMARPAMDGMGIDIMKTVEPLGLKVEFDREGKLLPAWYTMVLLD